VTELSAESNAETYVAYVVCFRWDKYLLNFELIYKEFWRYKKYLNSKCTVMKVNLCLYLSVHFYDTALTIF